MMHPRRDRGPRGRWMRIPRLGWMRIGLSVGLAIPIAGAGCTGILGLDAYKLGDGGAGPEAGGEAGTDGGPGYCVDYPNTEGKGSGTFPSVPPFDGSVPPVGACIPAPPPVDAGADAVAPARPKCDALTPSNPVVYVLGTAKDFVKAIGTSLFKDSAPVTLVWAGNSSCDVWNTMIRDTPPPNTTVIYWDATGKENACDLPKSVKFDIGAASVFADTCQPQPQGLPPDIVRKDGPVSTMLFVVPKASKQTSITRKAARQLYGYGDKADIAPWTDPNFIFRLADDSGTQNLIAAGIGVPAKDWKGKNLDFTDCLLDYLASSSTGNEEKIIAPLAYSNLNQLRATQAKPLAFQNDDQTCAYYPDSNESSRDKKNVRNGRYFLWGPTHIIGRANASPQAKRVANILSGIELPPGGADLVEVAVNTNLVPSCAMEVRRETEMGPLVTPDSAIKSCGCYFDKKAVGATSCTPCTTSADCSTEATNKVCSYNYCEAR
jgi:hypothetical protein